MPRPSRSSPPKGATGAAGFDELVRQPRKPRAILADAAAGPAKATEEAVAQLADRLEAGDVLIDGGNAFWKDEHPAVPQRSGSAAIHYLDVGTSGGVWGLERGYCMMIGGEKADVDRLDPISRRWLPGSGAWRPARAGRAAIRASTGATSTPGRAGPATS